MEIVDEDFFKWLELNDDLDFYEAALDISQEYSSNQDMRLKAQEDIDNLILKYKKGWS